MRIRNDESRAFWTACVALVLVAAFFGFRGHRALSAGTFVAATAADNLREGDVGWMPDTLMVNRKAAYLEAAVAGERDPFSRVAKAAPRPKAAPSGTKSTNAEKPRPPKLRPPSLRALLFDTVHPAAKLSRDGKISGWLHVGDEFLGWEIVEITSRSVLVEKNGNSKVLE